jgi:aminoglycoside phosphotransferase (APT) family kinase protein
LIPPNILVDQGRVCAIIDFGEIGIGDPAIDVIPAWSVFSADARSVFRCALGVDEATWVRGRGLALHQALLIIPYYPKTNPAFVEMAKLTVERILADTD